MNKSKIIKRKLYSYEEFEFTGDIENIIYKLSLIKDKGKQLGFIRQFLQVGEAPNGYDLGFELWVERYETKQEVETRLKRSESARKARAKQTEKQKAEKEKQERKTFEQLKKKYG